MKIKIKEKSYAEVLALPPRKHQKPLKPGIFWRVLMRVASTPDLVATRFTSEQIGMEKLGKREPAFFLMNHSSFIDLKIASNVLFPRPFNIVCTTDGFVGKSALMRRLGCIPTNKFVTDLNLVRDMVYATRKLKSSVLMFPEAGSTFDGTTTLLPDSLGKCVKLLGIPLVMIRTDGAFARDPLYNNLQLRNVKVHAKVEYLLSAEQIHEMPAEEINALIEKQFSFDNFRWQQENHVFINEPVRADHLDRLLYKCPSCHTENKMVGEGVTITCHACNKCYELDEYGNLSSKTGATEFPHIPDWYAWERADVKREIEENVYRMDAPVDIYVLCDTKSLYHIGEGRLKHSRDGFHLTGCDGVLDYTQDPFFSYSLNADFNWYEIGDVIAIGNNAMLYYCFPKNKNCSVTKARLATEELYKMISAERATKRERNRAEKAEA